MEQFSIKDLFNYNSPCLSCGLSVPLKLVYFNKKTKDRISDLKYVANDNIIVYDLHIKYKNISKLSVDILTNEFLAEDSMSLYKLLDKFYFTFESKCLNCYSYFCTNPIQFDFRKNIVKPLLMNNEFIFIKDGTVQYFIVIDHLKPHTHVSIHSLVSTAKVKTLEWNSNFRNQFKGRLDLLSKIESMIIYF